MKSLLGVSAFVYVKNVKFAMDMDMKGHSADDVTFKKMDAIVVYQGQRYRRALEFWYLRKKAPEFLECRMCGSCFIPRQLGSACDSEGNDGIVKDSKEHDVVDEDRLEVPAKSKKKTNSNKSSKARVPSWIAFGWNPCCCYGVLVASIPCCQHSE